MIGIFSVYISDHIPFRDSKLTRLLQPALLGQSKICIIATINPVSNMIEESVNTLKFAARAKKIVPRPVVIQKHVDEKTLLKKYREEIDQLKLELENAYKLQLKDEKAEHISEDERKNYEDQLEESRIV
jgi:centromeric protein E